MGSYSEEMSRAVAAIESQQPKEHNAVWCVGEQLKDILNREPQWAGMVAEDLSNPNQSLKAVEKLIAEQARKNKVGNCGCVTPMEAEGIIRKAYGIPEEGAAVSSPHKPSSKGAIINLEEFF